MTTKIRIVIRSFDHPFLENHFWGLPPYTRKIGLPESRVLYTVLRSPHIDKKSRELFFLNGNQESISGHKNRKALIAQEVLSVKTPAYIWSSIFNPIFLQDPFG
uniref:ribosomal protein S10 n=1 Tax=Actinidia latifolia TaxID=165711 RepID=UPI0023D86C08|nr:ribosomal protein S10 [Actinidia latifolia]WDE76003.1 ribosomal protein S10 [Actinidia latifolia]